MTEPGAARDGEEDLQQVKLQQLEELREKIRQVRDSGQAGPNKRRSQRFHAEVRRIEEGNSALTIWQALQRERQFQRNRLYRLDLAMKCAAEGQPVPAEYEQIWPPGTWKCGLCRNKNFPREVFARARRTVCGAWGSQRTRLTRGS